MMLLMMMLLAVVDDADDDRKHLMYNKVTSGPTSATLADPNAVNIRRALRKITSFTSQKKLILLRSPLAEGVQGLHDFSSSSSPSSHPKTCWNWHLSDERLMRLQ
jgi:hypothetical protein